MSWQTAGVDLWRRLETYRQRYPLDDQLQPLLDLKRSIARRRSRSEALVRRLEDLHSQAAHVRKELQAIESEISGSRQMGALLIEEIIDRLRTEMGEAWSPTPIRGFRAWRISDNRVMGNQVHWQSPTLHSECLRELPGEDLPHPVATCGPPACGIYAVKSLDMFDAELAAGNTDRSIVGVVAMTGKVVEHEAGYRSQCATTIAVAARYGVPRLVTDNQEQIEELFDDPFGAISRSSATKQHPDIEAREFLESAQSKEEQWI